MMNLQRFYVRKFRSVDDSGWIDADKVATLVGINEAGKSNLLLALWKLNPAREGEINLLTDLPRELYSTLRDARKPDFIEAEFELTEAQTLHIAEMTDFSVEDLSKVVIKRNYDGQHKVSFPDAKAREELPASEARSIVEAALTDLTALEEKGSGEKGIKEKAKSAVRAALNLIPKDQIDKAKLNEVATKLRGVTSSLKTSEIAPRVKRTRTQIIELRDSLDRPHPDDSEDVKAFILGEMPSFVYYSTYGNLDSEIYLPHVIDNLQRSDLTGRTAAQTRTLRVLFNFVGLNPREILEKGKEPLGRLDQGGRVVQPPTEAEIEKAAKDKQERDVLLHSASTRLTREFKRWWQQGNYVFDLAADGNHFRIWVSDEERPAKIELENRSTGLQWFLSFFLIFLVESGEAHKGSILLLDEAGLSLHAIAQKDLIYFFEKLSETNPIVHTTHSPFLVNVDHIDRVKVVYVDDDGYTVASSNLRAAEKDPRQSKSIYAVHAALGLSVSEVMLQGCHSVIVEGQSDQYYLSAIKLHLISQGLLKPQREIMFLPSGGVRGVASTAAIVASKDDELPFVLLDSDQSGQDFRKKLLSGQFKGVEERVITVGDVMDLENAEIEDLIPFDLMRPALSRLFRDVEDEMFEDVYEDAKEILPQIEMFADTHNVKLKQGWKVDLARQVKGRLLQQGEKAVDAATISAWETLFKKIYPQ